MRDRVDYSGCAVLSLLPSMSVAAAMNEPVCVLVLVPGDGGCGQVTLKQFHTDYFRKARGSKTLETLHCHCTPGLML